ncbi:1-(5-phosphoribosyl)-5-[(5-phosphoribosylamino)methylideneamino]imidazole-4-carboxamide isomerase [Synechococcus sp. PCC 7336]|uniref:1-(5-phosphoribosyl)-5-[(5- phosphoribosylamino)methylideneamino]imidazole-4- carboxamide isomerase n=1 Tax=Synechococcus sp. PCC 7336 TaxID=195250 RepID=UPI0003453B85|nr:1-(5-phosphoribosyl)-5-[(5-phosphoribosylamino)methylideneamino]imidazole-4-carboxamide isomerase [Synechococcus sp. PCC 7336]
MEVIPAIDLLGGRCVRLFQGDYDRSEVFGDDPVAMARRWADAGATRLHLVDLDGAKTGEPVNFEAIRAIVSALDIPVQVGGGVRSLVTAEQLLGFGVDRVIVGTLAVEQPELLALMCDRHPHRIAVGIDARNGKVATRGWVDTTEVKATDLVEQVCQHAIAAIIYTDIHRDGTLSGPNIEQLRAVTEVSSVPAIASGGISSITDLLALLPLCSPGRAGAAVVGAIVGKALYAGSISLKEALQAVGNGRWQDIPETWADGSALA